MNPGDRKTLLTDADGLSPDRRDVRLHAGSVVELVRTHNENHRRWLVRDGIGDVAWVPWRALGDWDGQEDWLSQGKPVLYPGSGKLSGGQRLFADGGVIGRNPSPLGGTFAYCVADGGVRVLESSGVVRPSDLGTECVTNNNTELLALLEALERLTRQGWKGEVLSDSKVALGWVFDGYKLDRVPPPLAVRVVKLRKSRALSGISWTLLQGHPTKADLEAGVGAKRGLPVHEHNVWADKTCRRLAEEFLAELDRKEAALR